MPLSLSQETMDFIKSIPSLVIVWNLSDNSFVYSNRNNLQELGYDEAHPMSLMHRWKDLIHADDLASLNNLELDLLSDSTDYQIYCNVRLKHSDGAWSWYSLSESIFEASEDKNSVISIITLNQNKHSELLELSLIESNERFKTLADASFGGIGIHDKGLIIEANQELARMTGFEHHELIGMDGLQLIAPEQREFVLGRIISGYESPYESLGIKKDGTTYHLEIQGKQIPYKGKIVRVTEFRNIDERKKISRAMKSMEQRYENLFEFAVDGILIGDKQGIVIKTNQRFLEITGKKMEEVEGNHISKLFPTDTLAAKPLRFDILQSGKTLVSERDIVSSSGEKVSIEMHSKMMPDGTYHSIVRDISQRKKSEEELVKSDRIFKHSNDMLCIAGFDGYFKTLNPSWSRVLGWCEEELLSKPWIDFVHPDDKEITLNIGSSLVNGREVFQFENRYICKDGSIRWLSWNSHPYAEEQRIYAVARDITERKQLDLELATEQFYMQTLMNNVTDQIYFKDLESRFIRVNQNVAKRFGLSSPQQAYGKTDFDFFAHEHAQHAFEIEQRIISTGEPVIGIEEQEKWPDGSTTWVSTTKMPLRDKEGRIVGTFGVSRDITDRKKAEDELLESNARLRLLSDNLPMGLVFQIDSGISGDSRKFTYISGGVEKIHGVTPEQVMNDYMCLYSQLLQEDAMHMMKMEEEALAELKPLVVEVRFRSPSGEIRWLLISSAPRRSANGHLVWDGIEFDITDSKRAKDDLLQSYAQNKALLAAIPDLMFIFSKDGVFEDFYAPAQEKLLVPPPAFMGKHVKDVLPDFLAQLSLDHIASLFQTGESQHYEYSLDINGQTRMFDARMEKIDEGKAITICRDITERRRSEEAVELERAYFEQLFDSSPEGIVVLDTSDNVIRCNEEFTRMFGYTQDEAVGKAINQLIVPDELADEGLHLTYTVANGKIVMHETKRKRKNGSLIDVSILGKPIHFKGGQIAVYGIYRDITDRKKVEEELIFKNYEIEAQNEEYKIINEELHKAKEKAEESDRLKSAFLANMSHEIRTPMNGILGFSQLLINPEIKEVDTTQYVEVIQSCGNQLLTIINDLIDISKIEANQISIAESEVDVNKILNEQFLLFEKKAIAIGINFSFDAGLADSQSSILTDGARLKQIISNLIGNALKFTHTGHVKYGYSLKGSFLEFYVEDTGIGIPSDYQEMVFERFRQVETRLSAQAGGTGLGLAISKAFINKMGGEIWVKSEPSKGSTFIFTIPYKPAQSVIRIDDTQKVQVKGKISAEKLILIAEDDDVNYLYLNELLSELEVSIIRATTGKEAIEWVRNNPHIALILMDIKMPDIDGYEATQVIKSIRKDLPIIAQTAYAFSSDKEKALSVGCNDYIAKPIEREKLFSILSKYL